MTIVDFIEQRLAEDEAVANAAAEVEGAQWRPDGYFNEPDKVDGDRDTAVGYDMSSAASTHIARHDPARVLRQVKALRSIVEMQAAMSSMWIPNTGYLMAEPNLQFIASIWSDHPDYRQEWA